MEALGVLIVLGLFLFGSALAYRNRVKVGLWLKDPSYSSSLDPQARRKRLARLVEDAQDELTRMNEEETKTKVQ